MKADKSNVWTKAESNILSANVSTNSASRFEDFYMKGEVDQFINQAYSNLQKTLEFPASEGTNSYGALSIPTANDPSLVRRISGVSPISTSLSSSNPLAWNGIRIGLDMYFTKT